METKRKDKYTPARKASIDKYKKDNCKRISVNFFPPTFDAFEHLEKHGSKGEYIRNLIRADMEGCVDWDRFNKSRNTAEEGIEDE